jgi:hypothetical protein
MPTFSLYLNRRRHWIDVYIEDVHPSTFKRRGGGYWGFFIGKGYSRGGGLLGEVHLVKSRLTHDLIVHEFAHAAIYWYSARGVAISGLTEEAFCTLLDSLVRVFYRQAKRAGLVVK